MGRVRDATPVGEQAPATSEEKGTEMKNMGKVFVVVALIIAVAAIMAAKRRTSNATISGLPYENERSEAGAPPALPSAGLPRLVDLGADKCIPCRMMAPILEDVKRTYADRLRVEFIDVWKHPRAGEQYRIRVIPTQIFFAPDGRELYRHEGFMSKEDILKKWAELGFNLRD